MNERVTCGHASAATPFTKGSSRFETKNGERDYVLNSGKCLLFCFVRGQRITAVINYTGDVMVS